MSKKQRPVEDWLADVVHWGERMAGYIEGMDEEAFAGDLLTQDAVIRCLECIGEAAHHLQDADHSGGFDELELAEAYWTRNRLAHGYYDISAARVWATASGSAARFVEKARKLYQQRLG
jgi:uncharacterized protein with HEPN domain